MPQPKGCIPWNTGKPCSEETKRKIGLANKNRKFTKKHRNKISKALKGRIFSDETIKKMSIAKKGRKSKYGWKKGVPLPEKTKRKISKTLKGRFTRANSPHWKGGRRYSGSGYVLIYNPEYPITIANGYVFEHRSVVEKHIKRFLTSEEEVHHLGKKDDNRPHMLMAFKNHSIHSLFHKNPSKVKISDIIFDGRHI